MGIEAVARRSAMLAALQSFIFWGLFTSSWFLDENFSASFSLVWVGGISLLVPSLILVISKPENVGNLLEKHLHPKPPCRNFRNVVNEIGIALVEPVESIQTYDCSVANIAMLPCSDKEIVVATSEALQRLNRSELQALVAAQFVGMRNTWCRLATRAEIMWWLMPWMFPLTLLAIAIDRPVAAMVCSSSLFLWIFLPRTIEQARDLCADVAAIRTTLDPQALANAMRKLAEQAGDASKIRIGPWYLPINPFIVVPKRLQSTTTASSSTGGSRTWTSADEVRMELNLRADRAEAMAKGDDPKDYARREFRKRWAQLGR